MCRHQQPSVDFVQASMAGGNVHGRPILSFHLWQHAQQLLTSCPESNKNWYTFP